MTTQRNHSRLPAQFRTPKLNLSSAVSDLMLTSQDRKWGHFKLHLNDALVNARASRDANVRIDSGEGGVGGLHQLTFLAHLMFTFPTSSPEGIPLRTGRCPPHLSLTGKEVGTSGEKNRIHGRKKTKKTWRRKSGGGERLVQS